MAKPFPTPSSPPSSVPDAAARVDQGLIARAYKKLTNQQELSRQERAALKRFEKDKEQRLRWQYYSSIPQKHWRQMSGRQTKVLNEQAARFRSVVRTSVCQTLCGRSMTSWPTTH